MLELIFLKPNTKQKWPSQLLVCYVCPCMQPYIRYMKSTIMSNDDVLRLIVTKKKLNVKEPTTEDKLHRADLLCQHSYSQSSKH